LSLYIQEAATGLSKFEGTGIFLGKQVAPMEEQIEEIRLA
jgi:hypothetical protein